MNYYYFAASLPHLSLGSPPSMSRDDFRQLCKDQLTPEDYGGLLELMEPGSGDSTHPFVRAWQAKDGQIRNTIARLRCARAHTDPSTSQRDLEEVDASLEKLTTEAMAGSNPLDREYALDQIRWQQLDLLSGFDIFNPAFVLSYAIRLSLAERWDGMDQEKGTRKIEEILKQQSTDLEFSPA